MPRVAAALTAVALVLAGCADDAPPAARPSSTSTAAAPLASTSTTHPEPELRAAVGAVSAEELGVSWRAGCPVDPAGLRAVDTPYWGVDGEAHQGRIVVAAAVAEDVLAIFGELHEARYPIERMEPITAFAGDDIASVLANNTSGFNCRFATGSATRWSEHAYGRAIDLNPMVNPYITSRGQVVPEQSAPYVDRSRSDIGMIREGDAAVVAFEARGWVWGGRWASSKDYQHFSTTGR